MSKSSSSMARVSGEVGRRRVRRWAGVLAALALLLAGTVPAASANGDAPTSISGRVTSPEGRPVVGLKVFIARLAPDGLGAFIVAPQVTDADGRYVFTDVQLGSLSHPSDRSLYYGFVSAQGTEYATELMAGDGDGDETFEVVAGAQIVKDVQLAPEAVLAGVITDDAGRPLANVGVRAYPESNRRLRSHLPHASTDIFGRFRIGNLPADGYAVRAHGGGALAMHWWSPGVPPSGWDPPAAATRYPAVAGGTVTLEDWAVPVQDSFPRHPFTSIVLAPSFLTGYGPQLVTVDASNRTHTHQIRPDGHVESPYLAPWELAGRRYFSPGDWNGDRRTDLLSVTPEGALKLHVLDPDVGWSERQIGRGWSGYRILPSGDVTGDGAADLLAVDAAGRLWVYPGTGDGGFAPRLAAGRGWATFEMHAAGDATGDRRADLLGIDAAGRLWLYAGRGGGSFDRPVQVGRGWSGMSLASGADVNGDRIGDLVGRQGDGDLYFYVGRPGGGFGSGTQIGVGW